MKKKQWKIQLILRTCSVKGKVCYFTLLLPVFLQCLVMKGNSSLLQPLSKLGSCFSDFLSHNKSKKKSETTFCHKNLNYYETSLIIQQV